MRALGILSTLFVLCASELGLSDLSRDERQMNNVTVQIRDLTKRHPVRHPDRLLLQIRSPNGQTEKLVLKRNAYFSANFPVTTSENGLKKRHAIDKSNEALYLSERAAFHVSSKWENDHYRRSVEIGFFIERGEKSFIEKGGTGKHSMFTPPISSHRIKEKQALHDDLKPRKPPFKTNLKYPTSEHLYVDILMVIDYGIYAKMGEKFSHFSPERKESKTVRRIREYYGLVGAGIAHRYEQVDYDGMTIKPRIAGILILKTESDDQVVLGMNKENDEIHATAAVAQVSHWIQKHKRKGQYRTIDHTMAFTSHRMYSLDNKGNRSYGTVGKAYVGNVCKYWQGSLNEDDFSMGIIGIASHELGHNLGAEHDSGECSDSYIMSPHVTSGRDNNFGNQYRFSACSLKSIHKVMTNLNAKRTNCMSDRPPIHASTSQLQNGVRPGREYTMDQQCQMFTENERAQYCGPREGVCRQLPCDTGFGCLARVPKLALFGTPCGQVMECRYGVCVEE